jgi:serine/threonine protein phosphatase PrpC
MINSEKKAQRLAAIRRTQPIRPPGDHMPSADGGQVELTLDYHSLLDRGLARERNEDRCGIFIPDDLPHRKERGRLFVVADGMGGHAAGDVAAETAVFTIQDAYFLRNWNDPPSKLRAAFLAANDAILNAAREGGRQGMGAAGVAVAVVQDRAYVAHLGDCRAYLIRGKRVTHMTSDHSWVQDRIDAGRLTEEEARAHPYRNVLTRALGADVDSDPDVNEFTLTPGDTILLCSDGLWGVAEDSELAGTVSAAPDAAGAARALVDLALARGGPDNISVIVIRVVGPNTEAATMQIPLRET